MALREELDQSFALALNLTLEYNVVMQRKSKTSKLKHCMTANVGREKNKTDFKILY